MNSRLKPYEEYKETDLLWLDKVPKHWELRKIKHIFRERTEKGYPDEPLLAATQTKGVIPKSMYENRTVIAQKDLHLLKLVRRGDFVISLRSFQGGIEYAYYQGIISPAYTIMDSGIEIDKGYFRHLAKSRTFLELLKLCVTGIREGQNIDYSMLKNYNIPLPPKEEQDQIVRYLDSKLSKINKFIKNKKKLIELLKEQKQAVINQVVTKGLDPNVKMKPSGIVWLGDIPEGWEKDKIPRLFKNVGSGTTPASGNLDYYNGNINWINSGDLNDGYIVDTNKKVTKKAVTDYSVLKMYPEDTIVIAMYGATIGKLSITKIEACCNQACCCLGDLRDDIELQYVFYVLLSCRNFLIEQSKGGGQPNISQDIIKKTWFPIPPIREQKDIISCIETKLKSIDKTIDKIQKEIDLITEYRTSLISNVATGKVDVRHIEVKDAFEGVEEDFEDLEKENIEE